MGSVRAGTAAYDRIGASYTLSRRTDPRWMAAIDAALGDADRVVNVGAGTGSYEPDRRRVVAVEPSQVMIAQRPAGAAPVVQATAERLPVRDGSFDVAMAVLTLHHWQNWRAGLEELQRVAARQVLLVFDTSAMSNFWLVRDYLPGLADFEDDRAPAVDHVCRALGEPEVQPLLVPWDMVDGVLAAHWARPTAYLDPRVRGCASALVQMDQDIVRTAMDRLRADLRDGTWQRRNADLDPLHAVDAGYRLVVGAS